MLLLFLCIFKALYVYNKNTVYLAPFSPEYEALCGMPFQQLLSTLHNLVNEVPVRITFN